MKNFKSLFTLVALFAILNISAFGQTALSTTTLGAALTSTATTVTLASTSTMLGPNSNNAPQTVLYVDKELMNVLSVVDSTHVTVRRNAGVGAGGRPATHANGATAFFAITTVQGSITNNAASYFHNGSVVSEVTGSCTAANELVLPVIYVFSGNKYDCLGGQWMQTNAPGLVTLGTTVASPAGVMTPTGTVFHVSGTNAVTGLTVPNGFAPGMSLYLIPDAAFTTTTATNISLASTAVANKTLIMTWDGTKWNPSY